MSGGIADSQDATSPVIESHVLQPCSYRARAKHGRCRGPSRHSGIRESRARCSPWAAPTLIGIRQRSSNRVGLGCPRVLSTADSQSGDQGKERHFTELSFGKCDIKRSSAGETAQERHIGICCQRSVTTFHLFASVFRDVESVSVLVQLLRPSFRGRPTLAFRMTGIGAGTAVFLRGQWLQRRTQWQFSETLRHI